MGLKKKRNSFGRVHDEENTGGKWAMSSFPPPNLPPYKPSLVGNTAYPLGFFSIWWVTNFVKKKKLPPPTPKKSNHFDKIKSKIEKVRPSTEQTKTGVDNLEPALDREFQLEKLPLYGMGVGFGAISRRMRQTSLEA